MVRSTISSFFDRVALLSTWESTFVIVILSFTAKLSYASLFGGGIASFPTEGTDGAFYDIAARNLLASGIYGNVLGQPTTGMPPGQSYFLALLYAIGGNSTAFARLAHVALLSVVAVLAYFTGKEMISPSVGFWAGVLAAVDPSLAYLSGTFLSDGLFIFLMVLGTYILISKRTSQGVVWWIAAGICFGLAGLTRNQGWLFSIALWLGALITMGRLIPIRAATVVVIASVLTVAPWTLRNFQVTGQFVPVSSEGGLTLWSGNNPEFAWRQPMPMSGGIYDAPAELSGPQIDAYYRQRAIQWIYSNPLQFAINGVRKVMVLYSFDPLSSRPEVAGLFRLAGLVPYGLMTPFIIVGLLMNLKNRRFGIILWYVLFTTVMAIVFFGDSRVRAPIMPYLYIFGVLGLEISVAWWRQWKQGSLGAPRMIRGQG